jgi:heme exporter protein C
MAVADRIVMPLSVCAAIIIGVGLYLAFTAPDDYQQGATVKILFIHAPSAWLSMMAYGLMAVAALGTLVWKHPLADVAAKAAVPIGTVFTLCTLITGSLWGRPMWGTWWEWDARMTSYLVLLLIYLGLLAIWNASDDPLRAGRVAAIVTLVGSINLPIIKFSVDWWNTLHQPASVMRLDAPAIHPSLLWPLLTMALGFTVLFFALHLAAMRAEIWKRRIRRLQLVAATRND